MLPLCASSCDNCQHIISDTLKLWVINAEIVLSTLISGPVGERQFLRPHYVACNLFQKYSFLGNLRNYRRHCTFRELITLID